MLAIRAPDGSAVVENALSEAGRERIGAFLIEYLGEEARGAPAFHYVPGHSFCDQRGKVVSLINLASLRDYEARVGVRRHRRRFRANVWFSGTPAWSERDWVGQQIQLGGAVLRVVKPITRCAGDRGEPGDGGARCGAGGGAARVVRAHRAGRACRGGGGWAIRRGRCDRGAAGIMFPLRCGEERALVAETSIATVTERGGKRDRASACLPLKVHGSVS